MLRQSCRPRPKYPGTPQDARQTDGTRTVSGSRPYPHGRRRAPRLSPIRECQQVLNVIRGAIVITASAQPRQQASSRRVSHARRMGTPRKVQHVKASYNRMSDFMFFRSSLHASNMTSFSTVRVVFRKSTLLALHLNPTHLLRGQSLPIVASNVA